MANMKNEQYGNSSISMLKGEERVRKRPAVIFGSDGIEGCRHSVFEILSYILSLRVFIFSLFTLQISLS